MTEQRRFYNRRKTVKIPPTKPLSFDYSGDLDYSLPPLDLDSPKLGFENSKELLEATEVVKKIYSLGFGDGQDLLKKRISDVMEKLKLHPADVKSLEVRIALQTVIIRNQIKHCLAFRKDKVGKAQLVERIQARTRNLRNLRQLDHAKFIWILDQLNIKYTPKPQYNRKLSKRATRKKAAREAAKAVRKAKLEAFRQKLEEEKVVFAEYKNKELARIAEELKELGAPEGASLLDSLAAVNIEVPVNKKEPFVSRRQLLLEKKFKLYAHRAKIPDTYEF